MSGPSGSTTAEQYPASRSIPWVPGLRCPGTRNVDAISLIPQAATARGPCGGGTQQADGTWTYPPRACQKVGHHLGRPGRDLRPRGVASTEVDDGDRHSSALRNTSTGCSTACTTACGDARYTTNHGPFRFARTSRPDVSGTGDRIKITGCPASAMAGRPALPGGLRQ
jgi:hypothetical protein